MRKVAVIWHTNLNQPDSRRILVVVPTVRAAHSFFDKYKTEKTIRVRAEWAGSPEQTIQEYLPNFIRQKNGVYESIQTWESLEIEEHDFWDEGL